MNRTSEFQAKAALCGSLSAHAAPDFSPWLRHAAACWETLARVEALEARCWLDDRTRPDGWPDRAGPNGMWVRDAAREARQIKLSAVDGGWALEISGVANVLVFRDGATAEGVARQMAARLNASEIVIYRGGGEFGGRYRCVA